MIARRVVSGGFEFGKPTVDVFWFRHLTHLQILQEPTVATFGWEKEHSLEDGG